MVALLKRDKLNLVFNPQRPERSHHQPVLRGAGHLGSRKREIKFSALIA